MSQATADKADKRDARILARRTVAERLEGRVGVLEEQIRAVADEADNEIARVEKKVNTQFANTLAAVETDIKAAEQRAIDAMAVHTDHRVDALADANAETLRQLREEFETFRRDDRAWKAEARLRINVIDRRFWRRLTWFLCGR